MATRAETPFTLRMRQVCDDAPRRCQGYNPSRFRQLIEDCGGDFEPVAKRLLIGPIQSGLVRLAMAGALDTSMEAVIRDEGWPGFSDHHRNLADWRLDEAKRMADSGEMPPHDY